MDTNLLVFIASLGGLIVGFSVGKLTKKSLNTDLSLISSQLETVTKEREKARIELTSSQKEAASAQALASKYLEDKASSDRVQDELQGGLSTMIQDLATANSKVESLEEQRIQADTRFKGQLAEKEKSLREQMAEREKSMKTQIELSEKKQAENAKKILKEIAAETIEIQDQERKSREKTNAAIDKERQQKFSEEFHKLTKHLKEIEDARAKEGQSFKDQFREILTQSGQIQKEAVRLTTALENVKVQGDFGEIRLERLLEYTGLKQGIHYETQAHVETEDGALRPDIVVNLPDNNKIIIDSKAPMNAFFDALEALNEDERTTHLKKYSKLIRSHVQALSRKSYQENFRGAAPFTVMFLPSESAFLAALEHDSGLLDYAISKEILIATSSTLVGLLKVVHVGHRQLEAIEESEKILNLAKEVYERGHKVVELTTKIGAGLKTATDSYNNVIKSYESRFLPKGRELAGFAGSQKKLPEPSEFKEMPDVRDPSDDKMEEGRLLQK